jgi:hypothetical protein
MCFIDEKFGRMFPLEKVEVWKDDEREKLS